MQLLRLLVPYCFFLCCVFLNIRKNRLIACSIKFPILSGYLEKSHKKKQIVHYTLCIMNLKKGPTSVRQDIYYEYIFMIKRCEL